MLSAHYPRANTNKLRIRIQNIKLLSVSDCQWSMLKIILEYYPFTAPEGVHLHRREYIHRREL
jgi:hypothetical protein